MTQAGYPAALQQRGMTLVELMVAMAISMLIVLAALAALSIARSGFNAIDSASQLRDNARFASELIQRIAIQAGFKELRFATDHATTRENPENIHPDVFGFNNALVSGTDPANASKARDVAVTGYGSDVLILQYQALETFPGSGVTDGSMINCNGSTAGVAPTTRDEKYTSVFHMYVSDTDGEPTLGCTTLGLSSAPKKVVIDTKPIVQGVEQFQVLYGVDGFTAANTKFTNPTDSIPEKYLRADQLTVGDTGSADTYFNWRQVRSIRIGMVLRGGPSSAQDRVAQTLYPFGLGKASISGSAGSALSSTDDIGTIYEVPADGRLRQTVTFTIHLRNYQTLKKDNE